MTIFALLTACTSFPSIEEACNDTVPGGDAIADSVDLEMARWMNCHRRQARVPQARVNNQLQQAVQPHIAYLETNKPELSELHQQPSREPFTGITGLDRARAQGWSSSNGSKLLEVFTGERYDLAGVYTGTSNFDLWFSHPVFRQVWLQNPTLGFAVAAGDFTIEFQSDEVLDIPTSFTYWNILYQIPPTPYAQVPTPFPPRGAQDVPSTYVHFLNDGLLELGGIYGYPITFTVGSGEDNLKVDEATLVGPSGPVAITVVTEGTAYSGLSNTVIVVPDDPLTVGDEYLCEVKLTTAQGTRTSRTTFTVGSREIPNLLDGPQARGTGEFPQAFMHIREAGASVDGFGPLRALSR